MRAATSLAQLWAEQGRWTEARELLTPVYGWFTEGFDTANLKDAKTLYDAENSSGLANGRPFPSLGSRDKPAQNADGSTDLYLGPKAPEGKTGNWLATVSGRGYFAILRLYGPTEAAFDKSWKPGDFEKVK